MYVGRTEHFSWYGDNSCCYSGHASRFSNTAVFHHSCRDRKYWKINIHYYKTADDVKVPLVYEKLPCLSNVNKTWMLDFLCSLVWPIRSLSPNWSGLMQTISKGSHPGKSSVTFLPMIDMDPTNMSCIYSTLKFVEAQCKKQHTTTIITFDQPLWWKAQLIVESEPPDSELRSIILCLGGFHAEMRFLGCIGSITSGSGIEDTFRVYVCFKYGGTHAQRQSCSKGIQRTFTGGKSSRCHSHRRCLQFKST